MPKYQKPTKKPKTKITDKHPGFQCEHCAKVFKEKASFNIHMETHSDDFPYKCEICDQRFKVKKYVTRHVRRVHAEKGRYDCSVCDQTFHFPNRLTAHMRVHTGEKPYECKECGKAFSSTYCLGVHTRIHTGEKPYRCKFCKYACRDGSTLKRHEGRHMGIVKTYTCTICDKVLKKKKSLETHIDEDHFGIDVRTFVCTDCGKAMKTKQALDKHKKVVHERLFQTNCEICGVEVNKLNMKSHLRVHVNIKPFVCTYKKCKMRFKDKGSLKKHYIIHCPSKQHYCEHCGRRFARKTRLNKHTKQHLPDSNNAQCYYCLQVFPNKIALGVHISKKHTNKCRTYVCDSCGLQVFSRRLLVLHFKYGHGLETDLTCKKCYKLFNEHISLRAHYLSQHNVYYTVLDKKEPSQCVVVKREIVNESVEESIQFDYDVQVLKQENDESPPTLNNSAEVMNTQSSEESDIEYIGYSQRVLSEDICRLNLQHDHSEEHLLDKFFVDHIVKNKKNTEFLPKKIVNEVEYNKMKKSINELFTRSQMEKEYAELEKVRNIYNKRILLAVQKKKVGKESKSIKYFNKSTKDKPTSIFSKEINAEENNINNITTNNDSEIIDDSETNTNTENDKLVKNMEKTANKDNDEVRNNEVENNGESDNEEEVDNDDDSDYVMEKETNKNKKINFNAHQCHICFKLFTTKDELKQHCSIHFELCSEKMLIKCPFCGYVASKSIRSHIENKHDVVIKIPYAQIKEKPKDSGSKYIYETNQGDLEIIPSINNLNKIASLNIDKKNRDKKNNFIGTTKLVRKGNSWVIDKDEVKITEDCLLPEFEEKEYKKIKKVGNDYCDRLKSLYILAKKRKIKMLFPCVDCEKVCLNMAALKLHTRKHEDSPKPFRPKLWINRIVKKKYNRKTKKSNTKKVVNESNSTKNVNDTIGSRKIVKDNNTISINPNDLIEHRYSKPNPVKNKHKCDKKLIEFYNSNIKGKDIEFWQFLKIFNKMSRDNVNTFEDLKKSTHFGIHIDLPVENNSNSNNNNGNSVVNESNNAITDNGSCNSTINSNNTIKTNNKTKVKKITGNKKINKVFVSKKERLLRNKLKDEMRKRVKDKI